MNTLPCKVHSDNHEEVQVQKVHSDTITNDKVHADSNEQVHALDTAESAGESSCALLHAVEHLLRKWSVSLRYFLKVFYF